MIRRLVRIMNRDRIFIILYVDTSPHHTDTAVDYG